MSVHLVYSDNELAIEVRNGPRKEGAPPALESGGHGLAGMRERVNAIGGSLQAGPEDDGGFRVQAVLPLPRMGA